MKKLAACVLVTLFAVTAHGSTFVERVSSYTYCQGYNGASVDYYRGLSNLSGVSIALYCGLPTTDYDASDLNTIFAYVFDYNDAVSVSGRICFTTYSSTGSMSCGASVYSGTTFTGFSSLQIYPPSGTYTSSFLPLLRVAMPSYDIRESSFKGFSIYKD
ncbi:MAG: hypothetical protein JRF33_09535 [Deltaproteobacteria bacterium]|nr:hypothetical protein [Deltaproteobacteria bacterium]